MGKVVRGVWDQTLPREDVCLVVDVGKLELDGVGRGGLSRETSSHVFVLRTLCAGQLKLGVLALFQVVLRLRGFRLVAIERHPS